MRTATFDCAQSWVDLAGTGPSALILPPVAAAPPGATLDVETHQADGTPGYRVYRSELDSLAADTSVESVDGPLRLLGGQLVTADPARGEVSELWTIWQVDAIPPRPLSLMAHLLGPGGTGVAVGDGLGFPIDQWQAGDVILQRHVLSIPADAPAGPYTVIAGAYWLDTMERWPLTLADNRNADQVTIAQFSLP